MINSHVKQKINQLLIDLKKEKVDKMIDELWLFGSSTRIDWHLGSDIDLAVKLNVPTRNKDYEWTDALNKIYNVIYKSLDTRFDFICMNFEEHKGKSLLENIYKGERLL